MIFHDWPVVAVVFLGFLKSISGTSEGPLDFTSNSRLEDELIQISADEPRQSTQSSVALAKVSSVTVGPVGTDHVSGQISSDLTELSQPTVTDALAITDYDAETTTTSVAGNVHGDHDSVLDENEYWEDMTMTTISPAEKEIVKSGEISSDVSESPTIDDSTQTSGSTGIADGTKALEADIEATEMAVRNDQLPSKDLGDVNLPMAKKASSRVTEGRSQWTEYNEQRRQKEQRKTLASYEDVMEIIVKVAEHPKDWEEIEQLLEKIEYEDATLKKAKSRLKALALKKQLLRKGSDSEGKKKQKEKAAKLENEVLAKVPMSPKLPKGRHAKNRHRSHVKTEVPKFRDAPHQVHITTVAARQDDYAVERPVTVIGERSRVDPVEKELLEESSSRRLREKARLAAAAATTRGDDDVEDQLKALSNMERRLKDHFRQKQELLQRIKQKNKWKVADPPNNTKW